MKALFTLLALVIALATATTATAGNDHGNFSNHGHYGLVCYNGETIFVWNVWKFLRYHEDATKGECVEVPAPVAASAAQVNRASGCANGSAFRVADASKGFFVDVTGEQLLAGSFVDGNGNSWKVTPANWVKGVGATCDNPLLQGYKYSGFKVDDSGTVNQAAPQFNIYPFYTK